MSELEPGRGSAPPYSALAAVYDRWTAANDYDRWVAFIERRWQELGLDPRTVLDVCCGTGTVAALLRERGIDVVGVDRSPRMLEEAATKLGADVRLVCQDVRDLSLPRRFDAAVWLFDSANYMLTRRDLERTLGRIADHLEPSGVLVFDVNTVHKLRVLFGDSSYGEDHDDFAYVWKNTFDPAKLTCTYDITLFVADGDGFTRRRERHMQRAYPVRAIRSAIAEAGLEFVGSWDDFSSERPTSRSMRAVFVAAKPDEASRRPS